MGELAESVQPVKSASRMKSSNKTFWSLYCILVLFCSVSRVLHYRGGKEALLG